MPIAMISSVGSVPDRLEDHTRAIRIEQFGAPDIVRVADVPLTAPAPGEVRIAVHAAAAAYARVRDGSACKVVLLPQARASQEE